MTAIPWILILVVIAIIVLGIFAILIAKNRKGKFKTDYYSLFVMGIIWLPVGIVMMITQTNSIGYIFFALGLIYFIIGLIHKSEWKKNHKTFKQMSKQERKHITIAMSILLVLLIAGAVIMFLFNKGIF